MDATTLGRVVAIAEAHHGVASRNLLRLEGLTPDDIYTLVERDRLEQRSESVFAAPGAPRTAHHELLAAVWDARTGAVATRFSGAALWELPGYRFPKRPEVLVKRGGDHRSYLGDISETSWLPPHHCTQRDGIPVATLARLCFELAPRVHENRLARTVDNAIHLGMQVDALAEVVGSLAKRGRPGSARMRRIVADRGEGYVPPASELEAKFLDDVIKAFGLPEPRRQVDLGDLGWIGRVDFAYVQARLVIELDGRRHWAALLDAQADRRRDARLVAAGWRVLRITWRMLVDDPAEVARLIRDALRAAA